MARLSDPTVLPALIDATWDLYNEAEEPEKSRLAGKLQELHQQLTRLTDATLDPEQQAYKDAVTKIQNATKRVMQSQKNQAQVGSAIDQIASVISVLGKLGSAVI